MTHDLHSESMLWALVHAGFAPDAGAYSGRGATLADVNDRRLERLHGEILKRFGPTAARSYVILVAELPSLSATDLLLGLGRVESEGWPLGGQGSSDTHSLPCDNEVQAWGGVTSALPCMGRDHTDSIRNAFLNRHRSELLPGSVIPLPEFGSATRGRFVKIGDGMSFQSHRPVS